MAVSTELVAFKALNISAGTPIAVPYPMYAEDEVQVYYGKDALLAVYNTDYTVTLQPAQFDTFTVTPTASLITKINDLIAADPTETNFVTIRSNLDYETSSTDSAVRYTPFTSREFDRTARRFAQVQDALNRALTLAPTFVGDAPMLQLNEVAPNRVLIFNAAGTAIEAGPSVTDIENAEDNAAAAAASAAAAATSEGNAANSATSASNSAAAAAASAAQADSAITNRLADEPTAVEGANNTDLMTPLRTEQHYDAKRAANADADAGTDNEKFMTAATVVRWFDSWVTRIFGTDSLPRTSRARFGDVVDLDDWLDGNGTLGTVAANDAQLAKLITYMNGAGAGKTYRSRKGRQYAFTSAFTVPSTVTMRLEGALWRYFGNTITSADLIHFNGCDFDTLKFHLPDTYFRVRPLRVTGCRGDYIECVSDVPVDNYNSSNIDWAVRLYGRNSLEQENRIGEAFVENFNKTVMVLGDSFAAADPQRGGYLGHLRLNNYEKGLTFRNVDGFSAKGGLLKGRTSGITTGQPGQNGVLVTSGRNLHIYGFHIEDSPEHGFRCAGDDLGVEVPCQNNHIHDITIKRAVQCGFKIWGGTLPTMWQGGSIHDITVEDAIWGNPNTTGFNYSAFLLQNFVDVNFSNLSARGKDQTYSGREAFFIGAAARSTMVNLRSYFGGRVNVIRMSEFNNGEGDTVNNLAAQNQLKILGVYGEGHTGDAIFHDHPTQPIRDVVITDAYFIGGTNGVAANAAAARFVQPCIYELGIRGHSGVLSTLPASANITTINKRTSVA